MQLLESALEQIGEHGWPATTVRAICARAHLTPRYFYESFPDRDALLLALFEAIVQDAATTVLEAVAAAPEAARAKARAAIGAFVEFVTEDRRRARVLFGEAMGSETLTRRRFQALRMFAGLVGDQAREFYDMRTRADPMVEMSALMVVGGFSETLLAWLDGSLRVTREQLVEDCADLFVANAEAAVALVRARRRGR
jgi:AcrR family transcriptional regulator